MNDKISNASLKSKVAVGYLLILLASGIVKHIQVDHLYPRLSLEQVADKIGADKARPTGYKHVFHRISCR